VRSCRDGAVDRQRDLDKAAPSRERWRLPTGTIGFGVTPISHARHRVPPGEIRHTGLYLRLKLCCRAAEERPAERGLGVSCETIRRWVLKIGLQVARNLCASRPRPSGQWHLDESVPRSLLRWCGHRTVRKIRWGPSKRIIRG